MTFPTIAGTATSSETSNVTTHTVNLPPSIASGELVGVTFSVDGAPTVTWPSGWVELFAAAAATSRTECRYRIADGTEGSTISLTTSVAEQSTAGAYRITGWHGTTVPEAGTTASAADGAPDAPSLSPSWGAEDTLWIAVAGWDQATRTVATWPTNYTLSQLNVAAGTQSAGFAMSARQLNASSEDPGAYAVTGATWVANTIAVRPAGAGGSPYTLTADAGSYTITGQAATPRVARKLTGDAGSYTVTGQAAGLAAGRKVALDAGSYTITGNDVTLKVGRKISLDAGSYTVTGRDATLTKSGGSPYTLALDAGSYTVTGQAAGLAVARKLPMDVGSYALTGLAAAVVASRRLALDAGAYTVTGRDATLTYTPSGGAPFTLTADAGAYTITGHAASLIVARALALEAGAYVVTGQDAQVLRGFALAADAGSYAVTGQAAGLVVARALGLDAGSYTITGGDAGLSYSGAAVQVYAVSLKANPSPVALLFVNISPAEEAKANPSPVEEAYIG